MTDTTNQSDAATTQPLAKPPDPPSPKKGDTMDIDPKEKQTFRDVLRDKHTNLNQSYNNIMQSANSEDPDETDVDTITEEEKARIYLPLQSSVIVKLVGKRISHQYLQTKLRSYGNPQKI